jgi:hypothetical protein
VEKFIGDAVMAVFGIPALHEDDALRAVRAADEMRAVLARLNEELERDFGVTIENRTGVNTGEVVTGDPASGQRLVTGDAVNVAARLEQAAGPGEVLLGATTYALVREAVEAGEVEPVDAKGKTDRVHAYRLETVVAGAEPFARHLESPLVGRDRELELLRQAYRRSVDEASSHLFTVLGAAGIGKSRAVQEFVAGLGDEATVVTGRCLSYGEGITYWPLVETLEQLGSADAIVQLLEGEPDAREVVNAVLTAVGQAESVASPEETPWAVRKLLEALAREKPLVVVFDDLQWAEATLLDLIEHVADFSRGAPILLLCVARPELLDDRPGWGGGKLNATSILLEPLSNEAADALIDNLLAGTELDEAARQRVAAAAEGNPLFVEQLLAMLGEDGQPDGELAIPPTIQALLAARLDRLHADERTLLERASVIGLEFWERALRELAGDAQPLGPQLQLLVRKELIRPYRSTSFRHEDAFRFRHLLIRDAAYAALPKELRATLHERFAEWLEHERSEYDEIVGYHLEQAYRYRTDLGPLDDEGRELGTRAGLRLGTAGTRALDRLDVPAATSLLERALAVLPADHPQVLDFRLALADAVELRGEAGPTIEAFSTLAEDAAAAGDTRIEWMARATLNSTKVYSGDLSPDEATRAADEARAALAEIGDDAGLARAWRLTADAANVRGDTPGIEEAVKTALRHARRAGDLARQTELALWLGVATFFGARPIDDTDDVIEELMASATTNVGRAHSLLWQGAFRALGGDLDGLADVERARETYAELGMRSEHGATAQVDALLRIVSRDFQAAERVLSEAAAELEQTGHHGYRGTALAMLADALAEQRKFDQAEEVLDESARVGVSGDAVDDGYQSAVRAWIAVDREDLDEAERLARESVPAAAAWPTIQSLFQLRLAEILRLRGKDDEAAEAAQDAVDTFEHKGVPLGAARARAFLGAREPA